MASPQGPPSLPGRRRSALRRGSAVVPLLLAAVVAAPGIAAVVPAVTGPERPAVTAPPSVPPWQQAPTSLSQEPPGNLLLPGPLATDAPLPSGTALAATLDPLLKADGGGSFTAEVQDALTGEVLYNRDGTRAVVPASNTKLLTAVAALQTMGPDRKFQTRVVSGPAAGAVVLVGGGDVLLATGASQPGLTLGHVGLATLAEDTVASLVAAGYAGSVTVSVDDSLFSGPNLSPAWEDGDIAVGEIAPVYSLALNSARYDPGSTSGPRPQDSALTAGQAFAAALGSAGAVQGLTVSTDVGRYSGAPLAGAPELATAESATVGEQVQLMLETSDNYLAEVLGRMAADSQELAASSAGAVDVVLQELESLGIAPGRVQLADVSGLTLDNTIPAAELTDVVRAMTSGTDLRLRAALPGFPVAGLTGTLNGRYLSGASASGAGLVRAKTGTLNTVLALSGYVVDADGRLLVFSFIGNNLEPGAPANKAALDQAASAVAGCGCQ